jgi:hypothetical protein
VGLWESLLEDVKKTFQSKWPGTYPLDPVDDGVGDAFGNIMATYQRSYTDPDSLPATWTSTSKSYTEVFATQEYALYGSSRLGIFHHPDMPSTAQALIPTARSLTKPLLTASASPLLQIAVGLPSLAAASATS